MVFGYKFIVNVWFLSLERIYTGYYTFIET